MRLRVYPLRQLPERVGDVPDDLVLREIDLVHLGGDEVDMDHLGSAGFHEERGFLDNIVTDVDHEIGAVHRAVHVVVVRERGGAEEQGVVLRDHPLAHLGVEERDTGFLNEAQE